jgi:uncharacterized protein (TIGR03034 family)
VVTIQELLSIASIHKGRKDFDPGLINGIITRNSTTDKTIKALSAFQKAFKIKSIGEVKNGDATIKKLNEIVDSSTVTVKKGSRNVLIAKSRRDPGKNADGTVANDMKYGDYTKEQIKKIRFMFKIDDITNDIDTISDDLLFRKFKEMATTLFSTGKLEENILKMIAKFKSNTGGTYSDPILTTAAREHAQTQKFEKELRSKLCDAIKKHKGDIFKIKSNLDIILKNSVYYNTASDIINGLTIATNDIWAYRIEIVEYLFTGLSYEGRYRITLYDHFGLDEPDVDDSKNYSYLAGFRAWFILQHLDRFAYKPFITVIELDYSFSGTIK